MLHPCPGPLLAIVRCFMRDGLVLCRHEFLVHLAGLFVPVWGVTCLYVLFRLALWMSVLRRWIGWFCGVRFLLVGPWVLCL